MLVLNESDRLLHTDFLGGMRKIFVIIILVAFAFVVVARLWIPR